MPGAEAQRAGERPGRSDASPSDTLVHLSVRDLTPRFLAFYETALAEDADAERRWELWEEHYDFAAVPPTPAGREMARQQLEATWAEYPGWMERIRAGAQGIRPEPLPTLQSVARLLELEKPLEVGLIVFVGTKGGGAFAATQNGQSFVAIPVEQDPDDRVLTLTHEFTHAVHNRTANLSGGWERTIARTALSEGLAMHVTRLLVPGRTDLEYIHGEPEWLREAETWDEAILRGILPYLPESDAGTVERFTIGTGATGLEREAYYVGWRVVGELLERGYTPAELARIPDEEIPALVEASIERILGEGSIPTESR